ncbi:MAG: YihY/virulence factor BrkB family protein [Nitriliruptoraceae bacterium]
MAVSILTDIWQILRNTQRRYVADAGDPFAAAIGFFGFLSLLPLLILAVSVSGFVLDDTERQEQVVTFVLEQIPGFEEALESEGEATLVSELLAQVVEQRGRIGLVGGVLLLLSGLRVVATASAATRVVFRGPVESGVRRRLRQLIALVVLGVLSVGSAIVGTVFATGAQFIPNEIGIALTLSVTFLLDVTVFLGAYVLLAPQAPLTVFQRLPGAIAAGAGWTVLKFVGASFVSAQIARANVLYGALGSVIGVLVLFYLAGRLYVYGATFSAILADRARSAGAHGPHLN